MTHRLTTDNILLECFANNSRSLVCVIVVSFLSFLCYALFDTTCMFSLTISFLLLEYVFVCFFRCLTSTFHSILFNAGRSNPQHKDIDAFPALYWYW